MTLQKMLFEYFKDAGCGGNKSAVARELKIPRPRVNAIMDTLDSGGGLGSTMANLLCAYRRKGLDINNVVDLYFQNTAEQRSQTCPGMRKIENVKVQWRKQEHRLLLFSPDIYKQFNRMIGQFTFLFCQSGRCVGKYEENCPCWWLTGLMHSICMSMDSAGTFDE